MGQLQVDSTVMHKNTDTNCAWSGADDGAVRQRIHWLRLLSITEGDQSFSSGGRSDRNIHWKLPSVSNSKLSTGIRRCLSTIWHEYSPRNCNVVLRPIQGHRLDSKCSISCTRIDGRVVLEKA